MPDTQLSLPSHIEGITLDDRDLCWLAGILEGEGSFLKGPPSSPNQPRIVVEMTDQDVVARVAELFGMSVTALSARQENWKPTWRTDLRGAKAVMLMEVMKPLMGARRQGQIDAALATYSYRAGKVSPARCSDLIARYRAGESAAALATESGMTRWGIYKMAARVQQEENDAAA